MSAISICSEGVPGHTVMAMTVNPDAGLSVPDVLHKEGLYAFRFDLNGDSHEDVTFNIQFGDAHHSDGDEHAHIQSYKVRRATGKDAPRSAAGEILIEGETQKVGTKNGVRAYVGLAPDLFAGDAVAIIGWIKTYYKEKKYDAGHFQNRQNFFGRRNVTAIVLEVPHRLIGTGKVHAWATSSLYGHAPEVQVQRWGIPLYTHIFLTDPSKPELINKFNAAGPAGDVANYAGVTAELAANMSTYAGSVVNPSEYGKQVVARLLPSLLPYELGTEAAFDQAGFNGRPLGDDVMDIMLQLASNTPLADGVAPDRNRTQKDFPLLLGAAYTKEEQVGVVPVPRPAKN